MNLFLSPVANMVGVHLSEWHALPHVLSAMSQTRTERGLGVDEGACVVFENEQIDHVLGESAYEITMTDFAASTHTISKLGVIT